MKYKQTNQNRVQPIRTELEKKRKATLQKSLRQAGLARNTHTIDYN